MTPGTYFTLVVSRSFSTARYDVTDKPVADIIALIGQIHTQPFVEAFVEPVRYRQAGSL